MGKAMRMFAGALGAGALLLSAAGTASAKGWVDEIFEQDIRCAASFSLLLPPDGCVTNVFIDNHKRVDIVKQRAGGDIDDTVVTRRGGR
ncbi:hypothetical protein ACWD6P_01895 [Streptomyces sp. NPDC002446]